MDLSQLKPRPKRRTSKEVNAFFTGSGGIGIIEEICRNPILVIEPGHYIGVHDFPGCQPAWSCWKEPDGSISQHAADRIKPLTTIPSDTGKIPIQIVNPASKVLERVAHAHLHRNFCQEFERCDRWFSSSLNTLKERLPEAVQIAINPSRCRRAILSAFTDLLDQDALELYRRVTGVEPEGIAEYNVVVSGQAIFAELLETNPGVIAWYVDTAKDAGSQYVVPDLHHPGQVVASVRQETQALGLIPGGWKHLTEMPAPRISEIFREKGKGHAVNLINEQIAAGVTPGKLVQQWMDRDLGAGSWTRRQLLPVIKMAYRESAQHYRKQGGRQQTLLAELPYVFDWAKSIVRNEEAFQQQTWKGCLKAAERWHRNEANREIDERRRRILKRHNGSWHAWNSLLNEFETQGLEVVPLLDEMELAEEAMIMQHCVDNYGDDCRCGVSRIFSIRRNNQTVATTEIRLRRGDWEVSQVRAHRNQRADRECEAAASSTALKYQIAWNQTVPNDRHQSWQVSADAVA